MTPLIALVLAPLLLIIQPPPANAQPQLSPDESSLTPTQSAAGKTLHTAEGTWNFSAGPSSGTPPNQEYQILLNNVNVGGGQGHYLYVANHGVMFTQTTTANTWYSYSTQSAWSQSPQGPLVDIHITCTPPTSNEDGSPVSLPLTYKFYHGTSNGTYPDPSPAQSKCDYVWGLLPVGAHFFVATATDSGGDTSSYSNNAAHGVVWVLPQAPSSLKIISGAPTEVFAVKTTQDRVSVGIAVGTVPPGTSCDPTQRVIDKYVVPRSNVTWYGNTKPQVVVATCNVPTP